MLSNDDAKFGMIVYVPEDWGNSPEIIRGTVHDTKGGKSTGTIGVNSSDLKNGQSYIKCDQVWRDARDAANNTHMEYEKSINDIVKTLINQEDVLSYPLREEFTAKESAMYKVRIEAYKRAVMIKFGVDLN